MSEESDDLLLSGADPVSPKKPYPLPREDPSLPSRADPQRLPRPKQLLRKI